MCMCEASIVCVRWVWFYVTRYCQFVFSSALDACAYAGVCVFGVRVCVSVFLREPLEQ